MNTGCLCYPFVFEDLSLTSIFFIFLASLLRDRFAPLYSTKFISKTLQSNVQSLINWQDTLHVFEGYYSLLTQIEKINEELQKGEETELTYFSEAIDASLQVENVSVSLSLDSSYTQGT